MISDRIRTNIKPNVVIPKPDAKADFTVKGWGRRRGQPALIYRIPSHTHPERPYEKGITEHEFEAAYNELMRSGEFTRAWFDRYLAACAKEGGCNFTTIGGIFELLQIARYSERGTYVHQR